MQKLKRKASPSLYEQERIRSALKPDGERVLPIDLDQPEDEGYDEDENVGNEFDYNTVDEDDSDFDGGDLSDDDKAYIKPKSNTIRLGSYTAGPIDPVTGQRGALPVTEDQCTMTLNYDDEEQPQDGLSYLRFVRREAASRPIFVTAARKRNNTDVMNIRLAGQALEIKNEQDKREDEESSGGPMASEKTNQISKEVHVQIMEQYKKARMLYEAAQVSNVPAITRDDLPTSLASWREFLQSPNNTPTFPLLSLLDQEDVFRLFKYFQRWITPNMSKELSNWMYGLLVRVADIIPAHEISILRQLCQKCIEVKSHSDLTNTSKGTIDLVICVVSDFFSQRDMAYYLFE
ncbi:survival motor neuron interacting protein 1-domain-containing protein [Dipodascopsis uninucleata]